MKIMKSSKLGPKCKKKLTPLRLEDLDHHILNNSISTSSHTYMYVFCKDSAFITLRQVIESDSEGHSILIKRSGSLDRGSGYEEQALT